MRAYQPFHSFCICRFQAKPGRDFAGDRRTKNGMIFGPPFANIVQKKCEIQHLAVDAALQNAAGNGQLLDQFATLDLRQCRDALDGVLVDCIAVVHIELHHRDDRGEFGDEGGEHAQFVHPP